MVVNVSLLAYVLFISYLYSLVNALPDWLFFNIVLQKLMASLLTFIVQIRFSAY